MLKYIFPILIFTLYAQDNITPYDLIKFENKYYIANSYNPYSGRIIDYYDKKSILHKMIGGNDPKALSNKIIKILEH